MLLTKVSQIKTNEDIWSIEEFLLEKRKDINSKYDYRYSQLIKVFSRLLSNGYLNVEDISKLSKEKRDLIKNIAANM